MNTSVEHCRCGAVLDFAATDDAAWHAAWFHDESPEHYDAVISIMTADEFDRWIDEINHGLGWAESESMGTGNDEWTLGIARALIRRVLG